MCVALNDTEALHQKYLMLSVRHEKWFIWRENTNFILRRELTFRIANVHFVSRFDSARDACRIKRAPGRMP